MGRKEEESVTQASVTPFVFQRRMITTSKQTVTCAVAIASINIQHTWTQTNTLLAPSPCSTYTHVHMPPLPHTLSASPHPTSWTAGLTHTERLALPVTGLVVLTGLIRDTFVMDILIHTTGITTCTHTTHRREHRSVSWSPL